MGLKLPMIDNVPASFGSLIDHTDFEVSQNYFAKYLWTPMGLKYIELERNASFIFEYQFKIPVKKNEKENHFNSTELEKIW